MRKLHVLRWDVRNLSKESWNLAQVRRDHLVILSQTPPGAVHHLLCVGKEVAATVRRDPEDRLTESVWDGMWRWVDGWMSVCVGGKIKYAYMCHSHPVYLVSSFDVSPCGMCQPVHVTGGGD